MPVKLDPSFLRRSGVRAPANDDLNHFGGRGGGMSDDWKKSVEDRLASLQADMREQRSDIVNIKIDIGTIKENMRHLPTKPWMFTVLASMVTVMIVLLTFIMGAIVRFLPHAG